MRPTSRRLPPNSREPSMRRSSRRRLPTSAAAPRRTSSRRPCSALLTAPRPKLYSVQHDVELARTPRLPHRPARVYPLAGARSPPPPATAQRRGPFRDERRRVPDAHASRRRRTRTAVSQARRRSHVLLRAAPAAGPRRAEVGRPDLLPALRAAAAADVAVTTAAYAGGAAAHSAAAAERLFPANGELVSLDTFEEVVGAVVSGRVAYGVLPIENSLAGPVAETHDLLYEAPLSIGAETSIPIRHHLVARELLAEGEVRVVRSHPVALEQCRGLLRRLKGVKAISAATTADAAAQVAASAAPGEAEAATCAAASAVVAAEIAFTPFNRRSSPRHCSSATGCERTTRTSPSASGLRATRWCRIGIDVSAPIESGAS